jgi:isoamylase
MSFPYRTNEGSPHPLGATVYPDGVNFSIFSEHATGVELLLFAKDDDPYPAQTIKLDPLKNRSFAFWHVFVEGLPVGTLYAYRVDGPNAPEQGHRFNPKKVLVDPYAKGISNTLWVRADAENDQDNVTTSLRGVVIDLDGYDWEGDTPLKIKMKDTIIYEMHVAGFTRSASSGAAHPGTFRGVIEKIPYLQKLGINAVELLPVFDFDDKEPLRYSPDGQPLTNYWGYNPIGFFAPNAGYCTQPSAGAHLNEFRDMVKALHRAGIQVILDVVYNHTNEGGEDGATINFRGLDNAIYYYLDKKNKRRYLDFTGCGNTFNCNHPIGEKIITDSLAFWVNELHVDGFRFDLASVLSRGEDGEPLQYPPVLWDAELMDDLADTKLIAEAWDAAGLYQIGRFPGYRWAEWNGKYRDDIRRFVRGDAGLIGQVASRIAGSTDLYQHARHTPMNSINFICCHDGFTMMDLVSYNVKHNEANGEGNRDGSDENFSCNYGVEGETTDEAILSLRHRQIKNFVAILLVSQGVPMILGGDEFGRTQRGNNNAYCQDNEVSWYDWNLMQKNQDLFRFFQHMIAFRKRNHALRRSHFFDGSINGRGLTDIAWHGFRLNAPEWSNPQARSLAFTMGSFHEGEPDLHIILNMDTTEHQFELPFTPGHRWYRFADTSLPSPLDIGTEVPIEGNVYTAAYSSVVILESK